MIKTLTKLILPALVAVATFHAQGEDTELKQSKPFLLHIIISQQNETYINVTSITAIAKHSYKLNGEVKVSEVTIDTVGNNTLRFYYVDTKLPSLAPTGTSSGVDAKNVRSKVFNGKDENLPSVKFPEGTYAHSVEYQLPSETAVNQLYAAAISVWAIGAPKIVTFKL